MTYLCLNCGYELEQDDAKWSSPFCPVCDDPMVNKKEHERREEEESWKELQRDKLCN